MDRFGPAWLDHARRIEASWREVVTERDVVLVPGDISWAMRPEAARPDLDLLAALPGHKVLLKGNHDYWWASANKVRRMLDPARFTVVHGDVHRVGELWLTGTRLWDDPALAFGEWIDWQGEPVDGSAGADEESERIFEREVGRLERALAELHARAADGEPKIVLTHYPPVGPRLELGRTGRMLIDSGAQHVVFGHLHAVRRDLEPPPFGTREGVEFHLCSCDYLLCRPKLVTSL